MYLYTSPGYKPIHVVVGCISELSRIAGYIKREFFTIGLQLLYHKKFTLMQPAMCVTAPIYDQLLQV